MPFNPYQICNDFRNWLIKGSNLRISDPTPTWTRNIKIFFGNYGISQGYEVRYTSTRKKEYLVDLVWQCENPDRYTYLALESELSERKREILYDFQKLVDIKSNKKIGIFKLYPNSIIDSYLQDMMSFIRKQFLWLQDETILVIFYKHLNNNMMELKCYLLNMTGTSSENIYDDIFPFPP